MIIAFVGLLGSGKTLSMIRHALDLGLKGRTIYTNFKLDFPKKIKIVQLTNTFFANYLESKFNIDNAVVLIDEIAIYFDSRNFNSTRNKSFIPFIHQSRKRTVDLYYTAQDQDPVFFRISGLVDVRIRKLTDYIVFCEKIKVTEEDILIKQTLCDNHGFPLLKPALFEAEKYYKYYDTNQIIFFDNKEGVKPRKLVRKTENDY